MIKRHVVRAILRDIFRIMSHEIYFSSLAIMKTSDEILFPTDKIGDNSEENQEKVGECRKKMRICARFIGRRILDSRKTH